MQTSVDFHNAATISTLRDVLLSAVRNLGEHRFEDELVVLEVDADKISDVAGLPGMLFEVVPVQHHDYAGCGVLRLDPARPLEPNERAGLPPNACALPLPSFKAAVSDELSAWHRVTDRVVLLLPDADKNTHEQAAVIRKATLSPDGHGSRIELDAVIVKDIQAEVRHHQPPYYGYVIT